MPFDLGLRIEWHGPNESTISPSAHFAERTPNDSMGRNYDDHIYKSLLITKDSFGHLKNLWLGEFEMNLIHHKCSDIYRVLEKIVKSGVICIKLSQESEYVWEKTIESSLFLRKPQRFPQQPHSLIGKAVVFVTRQFGHLPKFANLIVYIIIFQSQPDIEQGTSLQLHERRCRC